MVLSNHCKGVGLYSRRVGQHFWMFGKTICNLFYFVCSVATVISLVNELLYYEYVKRNHLRFNE